jgi:neurotransmitter:Na+ symporter, NSS family
VRVLTLEPPPGAAPDQTVLSGLGFVWNPNFAAIADPKVWLAAAGQILFTLGVGWGITQTYGSYIGRDDDVALTGLSNSMLNEVAEVVMGGTIALTAAVVFFGIAESTRIAQQGSYDLGFHAMPLVMEQIPGGRLFGAMWFLLLFFAGITSSVAMLQPTIAMLREDFGLPRPRAVLATCALAFVVSQPVIFCFAHGFMDQLDFWAGSFGLLLFGFVEILVFTRAFGMERGWEEITHGAKLRIPSFFRFVIAWVMPLAMGAILLSWSVTNLGPELSLAHVEPDDRPYVVGARALVVALVVGFGLAVRAASHRRRALEGAS